MLLPWKQTNCGNKYTFKTRFVLKTSNKNLLLIADLYGLLALLRRHAPLAPAPLVQPPGLPKAGAGLQPPAGEGHGHERGN